MGEARGLTARVVLLSVLLSALYTVVNTYLNVNFGMGFGFSAITILLAYGLFHKLGGGSDRREVATCVVAAGMGLPIGWTLAFIIFASEHLEGLELPWWLAPPGLGSGSEVPWSSWLAPLAVLLAINALSAALGLVMASATYGLVREAERMVFPFYRVPASIIGACFEEGGRRLRLVAYVMALGFAITLAQYVLEALGVPATLVDLSGYLPPGFILGAALSITFVACGFMVGAPVTLSMLASSLLAFTFITPYLVSTGALPAVEEPMELYMEAVMRFLISPALGMMLIGGLLASLFRRLAKPLRKAGEGGEEEGSSAEEGGGREGEGGEREPQGGGREAPPSLGYGELITCFFRSLTSSRRLLAFYLLILASSGLLAYLLNPLAPLSPLLSAAIAILSALVLSLLDFAIILKMAGELGMTSGTHQFWLYSAPILATGYKLFDPRKIPQYGYGRLANVFTSLEFERLCNAAGPTEGKIVLRDGVTEPKSVAILHCVGSRDKRFNSHCSAICCMSALKFGHLVMEKTQAEVYSFYIDMRPIAKGYEEFYDRLLEEGMHFVRGRVAEVTDAARLPGEEGKLIVQVEDTLLGVQRRIPVDMVILMAALEPQVDARDVALQFGISCSMNGWFTERHPKLDPVATMTDGIFIAGTCQGPKDIPDSVAQGAAAAARVQGMVTMGMVEIEPVVATILEDRCSGCRICNTLCPFNAITYDEEKGVSVINQALCKGCGTCVAACPAQAITGAHFSNEQIMAELHGLLFDITSASGAKADIGAPEPVPA